MTEAAAAEPHVAESDGLRRRHVNAAAVTDSDGSSDNQQQSPTTSTASTATTSTSTTTRRSKGFVELLFSPLSFVLGDGEPEDPQVSSALLVTTALSSLCSGGAFKGVGTSVHAWIASKIWRVLPAV